MLQPHVTLLPLLLVAATHIACVIAACRLFIAPVLQFPDWQVVRPAGMHWFSLFGCWGLSAIFTWVWLFVGSGRFDADHQMFMALLLILGFGAGGVWSAIYIAQLRRAAIRWRGTEICWQLKGKEVCQKISSFEEVSQTWDGATNIRFRDGTILKLDQYAQNAVSLFDVLWQSMGETSSIEGSSRRYSRFPIAARVHRASRIVGVSAIFVIAIMLTNNRSNPIYITAEYPEILKIIGVDRYMSLGEMWTMGIAFIVFVVACFCGVTTSYYMYKAQARNNQHDGSIMPVDAFRLRIADHHGSFVFAVANTPERLEALSATLMKAGGRVVGPGAWLFDADAGKLKSIASLFDRLQKEEAIYVLSSDEGVLSYGVIVQENTEGGIVVG